jgi:hypothetical protein
MSGIKSIHGNKGRKLSKEIKEKMAKSHTGIRYSEEVIHNMKKSKEVIKGVPKSDYVKEAVSKANEGKIATEETKRKISQAMKDIPKNRNIITIDGVIYKTLKEVSLVYNISTTACRHRLKSDGFPNWIR